ncbi:MAG: hypothetical protein ACTSSG_01220 [Candidatus Heimdallarchaeaceae archaeon]
MNSQVGNIRDELSEILFIKKPKIFVIEWLPFDSNQLRELNKKMDIEKGFHKTLLTGLIDESPDNPIFCSKGAHTKVLVKDYGLDSFVNLDAVIDLPEEEGIVQIEEMAIFISKDGSVIYSLELDEIEQSNSYMSIDKITRVIADLSQDSSVVIDSLLTQFQRNFIKIIFGNPIHRPKTICIVGEDIKTRYDDISDYYDGEDNEIELSQLLGEGHQPFQDGKNLFFKGPRGCLSIVEEFTEEIEYQVVFWGIQHAVNNFVSCYMSRIWELYDESKEIKNLVDEAVNGNTDALNKVQEQISIQTSLISIVSQIQVFLLDSCKELGKTFIRNNIITYENFFKTNKSLKSSLRRTIEAEKVIEGLLTELDGLRNYIGTLSELQMRKMSKVMTKNTKSMNEVLQANTRTSEAIDMIELILAGSIILEIFAFAVGEITADQTIFGSLATNQPLNSNQISTLIMFLLSIVAWVGIVLYLKWSKKKMEEKALRDFVISISFNRKINLDRLYDYLSTKSVITRHVDYESGTTISSVEWNNNFEEIFEENDIEKIQMNFNETSSLLLSMELETSKLELNQQELYEKTIELLETKGILI